MKMSRISRLKKVLIGVVLCITMLLTACSSKKIGLLPVESAGTEKKIQIGMSFDSFVIERWQRDRDVFVSTAKALGAEVNVQNANGIIEEQRKQIEYFIEKGVDAIVIVCIDSYGLSDVISKAHQAGIKVIAYDRSIDADIDLYISFDNSAVGRLMGNAIADKLEENGKVLMLGGSPTDSNVPLVENAFRECMEEKNIQILDSMHCENWTAELAADYLYMHEELMNEADAIMCGNDNIAGQVINVLAEKRLAGEKLVTGQDADLEACQRLVEDTQLMTVYKPVVTLAKRAAECTIELVRNSRLEGSDLSVFTVGEHQIPYIGMDPIAVEKSTVDDIIIASGFHMREDVYLNVPDSGK